MFIKCSRIYGQASKLQSLDMHSGFYISSHYCLRPMNRFHNSIKHLPHRNVSWSSLWEHQNKTNFIKELNKSEWCTLIIDASDMRRNRAKAEPLGGIYCPWNFGKCQDMQWLQQDTPGTNWIVRKCKGTAPANIGTTVGDHLWWCYYWLPNECLSLLKVM